MSADDASGPPPPTVDTTAIREVAPGVWVIPDHRVPLVPNIGIVLGNDAALVVDTGMGPANGERVLAAARKLAGDRRLILTLSHFHPEHGFGAQAFKGGATIVYNRAQRDDLAAKGAAYLGMFAGFGPAVKAALDGTQLVMPDIVYDGPSAEIDLGGRRVTLLSWGMAHTAGDQAVWLPEERVLFTGDLAEDGQFPIFPWFPPDDVSIDGARWAEALAAMEALGPAIVVPGHGALGGAEILATVRGFITDLAARVEACRGKGDAANEIVDNLGPIVKTEHPGWSSPEWVDFAIRYYASLG